MGGISFPLLADFHPKGAMADSFGLYLADNGITDRATVIIDAAGVIKHISAVGPPASRDIEAIVALCEKLDSEYTGEKSAPAAAAGIDSGTLYVKSGCGASRAAMLALENLHLGDKIAIKNVSDDAGAMGEMKSAAGNEQAPTLVCGDKTIQESADIVAHMASCTAPV